MQNFTRMIQIHINKCSLFKHILIGIFLIQYSNEKKKKLYACVDVDHCLEQLKYGRNDDLAIATLRQHAISSPIIPAEKLYCFDQTENICNLIITMWVRKEFPLLTQANRIIRYSFEAGLIQKWARETKMSNKLLKEEARLVILSLEHVASAMMVLGIGYTLSFLSIYSEPIAHRRARAVNCSWFWTFADQFFDGDRYHFLDQLG